MNRVKRWFARRAPKRGAVQLKVGSVFNHFVFDGDALYAGLGSSGVSSGDTIVACFASGVFVHSGGKCRVDERFFDQIRTREGKCEIKKTGSADLFLATDINRQPKPIYGTEEMELHGNVLMTQQMRGNKAFSEADKLYVTQFANYAAVSRSSGLRNGTAPGTRAAPGWLGPAP
jgi:hypothetical protein